MWKEVNNNKNKHVQEMCLIKSSGPQTSVTIKSTETCLTVTLITANRVFISQCIQSMNKIINQFGPIMTSKRLL